VAVLGDHLRQRRIVDVRQDVLEETVFAVALRVGALIEKMCAPLGGRDHAIDEPEAETLAQVHVLISSDQMTKIVFWSRVVKKKGQALGGSTLDATGVSVVGCALVACVAAWARIPFINRSKAVTRRLRSRSALLAPRLWNTW